MFVILSEAKDLNAKVGTMAMIPTYGKALRSFTPLRIVQDDKLLRK